MAGEQNTVIAKLTVTGDDLDPEAITQLTPLKPAKAWRAGDHIGRTSRQQPHNGYSFETPASSNAEDAVDALFSMLEAHWQTICSAVEPYSVELSLIVRAVDYMPALHLRRDQVQRLTQFGAELDIDVYCLMERDGMDH